LNRQEAAEFLHNELNYSRRMSAKLADIALLTKSSKPFEVAIQMALEKAKKWKHASVYKHQDKPGEGAKKRRKLKSKKDKVHAVMGEFKRGTLDSGSGKKVTDRSQAIAIAMSEAGLSK
jgi:Zn-dependent peptidase ImmA (M78 family)